MFKNEAGRRKASAIFPPSTQTEQLVNTSTPAKRVGRLQPLDNNTFTGGYHQNTGEKKKMEQGKRGKGKLNKRKQRGKNGDEPDV